MQTKNTRLITDARKGHFTKPLRWLSPKIHFVWSKLISTPSRGAANAAKTSVGAAGPAVDRKKLAAVVFSDPQQLARLNKMLHPRIREEAREWFEALERSGGTKLAFEDAALIFETGLKGEFDKVIVCWCRPEQQLARLAVPHAVHQWQESHS